MLFHAYPAREEAVQAIFSFAPILRGRLPSTPEEIDQAINAGYTLAGFAISQVTLTPQLPPGVAMAPEKSLSDEAVAARLEQYANTVAESPEYRTYLSEYRSRGERSYAYRGHDRYATLDDPSRADVMSPDGTRRADVVSPDDPRNYTVLPDGTRRYTNLDDPSRTDALPHDDPRRTYESYSLLSGVSWIQVLGLVWPYVDQFVRKRLAG